MATFLCCLAAVVVLVAAMAIAQNYYLHSRIRELQLQKTELALEVRRLQAEVDKKLEYAVLSPDAKFYTVNQPHLTSCARSEATSDPVSHLYDDYS